MGGNVGTSGHVELNGWNTLSEQKIKDMKLLLEKNVALIARSKEDCGSKCGEIPWTLETPKRSIKGDRAYSILDITEKDGKVLFEIFDPKRSGGPADNGRESVSAFDFFKKFNYVVY